MIQSDVEKCTLCLSKPYNMGSLDTSAVGFCEWVRPLWCDILYYCEKKESTRSITVSLRLEKPARKQQALRQLVVSYIRWKILRAIPLRKLSVQADCQRELKPTSSNILGANEIPAKVHHLGNSSIGDDPNHPKCVIQSCRVAWVSIIVQNRGAGIWNLICQEKVCKRHVTSSHICQSSCQVDLLPLPPESIEVGVM